MTDFCYVVCGFVSGLSVGCIFVSLFAAIWWRRANAATQRDLETQWNATQFWRERWIDLVRRLDEQETLSEE